MKKDQHIDTILGISVGSSVEDVLLKTVRKRLTIQSPLFVITPNPENILGASQNPDLQKIMNSADYAPVDGIGVAAAQYFLSLSQPHNRLLGIVTGLFQGLFVGVVTVLNPSFLTERFPVIKGRELFLSFLSLANEKKWRVYLLGGETNEAQETKEYIEKKYTHVSVKSNQGPFLTSQAKPRSNSDVNIQKMVISEIKQFKPHMLFVAFTFPKQETWLYQNLSELPVGLGMTVGGTFNFISGRAALPPKGIPVSLEWLWRLITQPWRLKRIVRATVLFPLAVFRFKIAHK